ncbi:DNA polymerase III subunit delta [Rubrivirga sp. SAORIC476]|uniref:DNA polymerase III subunit delta n=1 Tax=Rubrivirga sp. SAORIC476 TaxID=1961794 RepID=UPI000BA98BF7|nr:DNA polymerase III subunit delta [Rubrivirga sp. SAORIC476]MAQ96041.1 DNA polymerase III subunit delta [Rhodothermaceae bacterium]MBC12608.1 DNA polymerase III subunit delta [Rhodothermaceae bacterium]PAP81735.1 DNA polymerase III subunit delta [Rubrivirga sp. SAORIC476]
MAKGRSKTGASFDDLATGFKNGQFAPLYFFYGEEGWFMDELQRLAVDHAVAPHERDFNLDVVFGPEASAQAVLAQCAQFPMMAARRLVVVRGFEKLDDNSLFKSYAEAPNPHTVVVLLCNAKPNVSAHPYRALREKAVWSNFEPLKPAALPGWVDKRFRARRVETESGAAALLAEMAGSDLRSLDAEVEKLITYVGERKRVTRDDVLRAAGHSADQNPFELQSALGRGDVPHALAIADALLAQAGNRRGEAIRMVALLASHMTKLWKLTGCLESGTPEREWAGQIGVSPYFLRDYVPPAKRYGRAGVRRAFEALLAADLELKGGSHRDERLILTLALRRAAATAP